MSIFISFFFSLIVTVSALATSSPLAWYDSMDLSHYRLRDKQNKIPDIAKKKALAYLELYKDRIPNTDYVTIFDASRVSAEPRLHVIHVASGLVESYLVAHGKGSDKNHDGFADKFSNAFNSNATSLGFYLTDVTYSGEHGYSLRLKGLESTNSNAYQRAIVMHGADYVDPKLAATNKKIGRSLGCPAVETKYSKKIIDKIRAGSVFYIWK